MNKKVFRGHMAIKSDGIEGEVKAIFATTNVIDLDQDVTLPGAFTDNEKVRIAAWGHNWETLPVGRGEIHEEGQRAVMDGRFFLDTEAGKQHYLTVKNLGDLQEWSYGFDILEAEPGMFDGQEVRFLKKLRVHEVSPVMLGAGIDTYTAAIKVAKEGRRNSGKDSDRLQAIHDMVCELGAKCAGSDR